MKVTEVEWKITMNIFICGVWNWYRTCLRVRAYHIYAIYALACNYKWAKQNKREPMAIFAQRLVTVWGWTVNGKGNKCVCAAFSVRKSTHFDILICTLQQQPLLQHFSYNITGRFDFGRQLLSMQRALAARNRMRYYMHGTLMHTHIICTHAITIAQWRT